MAFPDGSHSVTTLAQPVKGTYTISFQPTGSGLGVVLVAYVTDASLAPAQKGTAVFQFCSLQGNPAPTADCDTGPGNWTHYGMAEIIPSPFPSEGHALLTYNEAPAPGTTIGFRFRYVGQGSGIGNGMSLSADHTF
jgi:hypothetical protein